MAGMFGIQQSKALDVLHQMQNLPIYPLKSDRGLVLDPCANVCCCGSSAQQAQHLTVLHVSQHRLQAGCCRAFSASSISLTSSKRQMLQVSAM